jgi:hypothetical protein
VTLVKTISLPQWRRKPQVREDTYFTGPLPTATWQAHLVLKGDRELVSSSVLKAWDLWAPPLLAV